MHKNESKKCKDKALKHTQKKKSTAQHRYTDTATQPLNTDTHSYTHVYTHSTTHKNLIQRIKKKNKK